MTVTWQTGIRLGKMKRKHDDGQSKEKDVNTFGTKRQKTIAEVTERLKRDLQQKLSIFTNPHAQEAESSVKHCYDKAEVKVSLDVDTDSGIELKAENNNNVTKEKPKGSEKVESDNKQQQSFQKVESENLSSKKEYGDDSKSSTCSQKPTGTDSSEKTQSRGKEEQKKSGKKEIPKQFKIHNPVGSHSWIQNIQNFMVQAAQYQQGLNSGAKSAPRTPTTPTGSTPGRTLLNNSTGQNAITVRNAQMRPIAPHPGKDTVRTLLENQRGVVGGIATAGTAPRNVRPSLNVKTPAVKQLGGCIDLTDDDDKSPPTKQATTVRTVNQTSQILSPVVQTPALRGNAVLLRSSPGGPLVLQPVTQGMHLAQQGNVVYASTQGGSLVRPGVTVAGQVPHFRSGHILVPAQQRSASSTTTVNRPPPPLKSAPSLQKHPAPLPPTPSSAGTYPKQPPPKPSLKISRVQQGIVLSWNMTLGKGHAEIANYQLFAYQETSAAPSTNLWKKVGDVKALPLPMACTLTQFQEGNKYHFAVRAIDAHNRMGAFSDACSIHLSPAS